MKNVFGLLIRREITASVSNLLFEKYILHAQSLELISKSEPQGLRLLIDAAIKGNHKSVYFFAKLCQLSEGEIKILPYNINIGGERKIFKLTEEGLESLLHSLLDENEEETIRNFFRQEEEKILSSNKHCGGSLLEIAAGLGNAQAALELMNSSGTKLFCHQEKIINLAIMVLSRPVSDKYTEDTLSILNKLLVEERFDILLYFFKTQMSNLKGCLDIMQKNNTLEKIGAEVENLLNKFENPPQDPVLVFDY